GRPGRGAPRVRLRHRGGLPLAGAPRRPGRARSHPLPPDDLVLPGRPGEVAAPAQAPTGTGRADGAALMRPPSPRPGPGAPRSSPQRSLREGAPAPPAGAGTPGYPYRAAPVPAPGA